MSRGGTVDCPHGESVARFASPVRAVEQCLSTLSRWSRGGVWHRVFARLAQDADFEEVFIDSTIVRAHQHAVGAPPKKRGIKR